VKAIDVEPLTRAQHGEFEARFAIRRAHLASVFSSL
jgi:hypothetical protein